MSAFPSAIKQNFNDDPSLTICLFFSSFINSSVSLSRCDLAEYESYFLLFVLTVSFSLISSENLYELTPSEKYWILFSGTVNNTTNWMIFLD